ncbi:Nramp family divalent metal transporter [Pauljensenia hongkongensis]|uniref:Divalent metal cation transporter n=1 Tax=Pauljensenia hongkongensis TaxID=178339 RepID=A0A1D8B1F9_9ACTO|nr:Nramp family divalent metal transporter [Pauljensenia hongkongensis]AOS46979.1 divalent metal cation transporter [Pauljensenia hongkongensis]EFW10356.1 NRAMP family metal ion transporter [Actinomyces sp. oral taxon 178 str. F0338]
MAAPQDPRHKHAIIPLLGPAFVAAVAYVDPGNVAANITAGARYGYLLVWVLVASNLAAMVVQYLSAKLGLVTGESLPSLLGGRLPTAGRIAFWAQAEIVAAATDLAEVIGGALALHLLFGVPLVWGGVIIGAVSMALLLIQGGGRQRSFENAIIALLVVITLGFLAGLVASPPDWGSVAWGMVPRFQGADSVLIAASMLGATIMPHAVYLHSSLVNDHEGGTIPTADEHHSEGHLKRLLRATRIDIYWALGVAGVVNTGLLLLAASALQGQQGTDTIEGAHAAIASALGPTVGTVFAVGLLASGLASTSVGAYAGSEIMNGLLHIRVPLWARRLVSLVPALAILAAGAEPTWALVVSQVALSFGIPFAIIPLVSLTRDRRVMGEHANSPVLAAAGALIAAAIVVLNLLLIYLTATGQG